MEDLLLDELDIEVLNEDDELDLEEILFPDFDEEEYLKEVREYIEYMRGLSK